VKDRAELIEKFCAADSNLETIVVLPASLFVDAEQMLCESGPYKLYRIIEATDTDDFEYFSPAKPRCWQAAPTRQTSAARTH
jgi:hypothetical protein